MQMFGPMLGTFGILVSRLSHGIKYVMHILYEIRKHTIIISIAYLSTVLLNRKRPLIVV